MFLATLPEMLSSAGKKKSWCSSVTFPGLLAWKALLNLTLCPWGGKGRELTGPGEGEELAGGGRLGGRRRRRVCLQPSSLPRRKGFHENPVPGLGCQRKRYRRRNIFWFLQNSQRLAQSCWCRRIQHFYLEQFSMRLLFPISNQNSSHQCPLCSPHLSHLCFLICPLYSNLILKHLPSLLSAGKAQVIFISP